MFPIPPLWMIKAGAGALLALLLVGGFSWWKHDLVKAADQQGYDRSQAEWTLREAGIQKAAEDKYASRLKAAQDLANQYRQAMDNSEMARIKENKDAEQKLATHVAAAYANAERLSISTRPAPGCTVPGSAQSGNPAAPADAAGEARTDLMPGTAAAFERIASDSARFVRDYNRVLDLYEAARSVCNAPAPSAASTP